MLNFQFHNYVKRVQETDCNAELRRLLSSGPPIWLSDKHGLPVPDGDTHIETLWLMSENAERTAKLDGAVEGEERQQLWDEHKKFLVTKGEAAEEGDDVEGEEA